jgi:inorganic pyrophosphatase
MITMTDEQGQDDKIIAVHADDPAYADYNDISALPQHVIKELQRFFEDYKILEDKEVQVGDLRGRVDAINTIKSAVKLYSDKKSEILKKYQD